MESKVIKAASRDTLPPLTANRRIVRRAVVDAGAEAAAIVAAARAAAARVFAEAEEASERIAADARDAGYAEGLALWNDAILGALCARQDYLARSEEAVLRLAVRIAEKIIGEQLRLDPATIVKIVREALQSAPRQHRLELQVNPADAALVSARMETLLRAATFRMPEIDVIGSAAVAPGGCVILSELGRVDARLHTQLQTIERLLLEARK